MEYFLKRRPWLLALGFSLVAHLDLMLWLAGHGLPKPAMSAHSTGAKTMRFQTLQSRPIHATSNLSGPTPEHTVQIPVREDSTSKTETQTLSDAYEPAHDSEVNPPVEIASDTVLPPTESFYLSSDQLTAKPLFLSSGDAPSMSFIPDVYPLPVVAHLFINAAGDVDNIVLEESLLSDVAKNYIVATFSAMKFRPGMLGTLPVKSQMTIEVKLDPLLRVH